jgi:hypothetical protein
VEGGGGQLFIVGMTVIDAVIGAFPVFMAVNEGIFPEPLATKPIAVLELLHENELPVGTLIKFVAATVPLLQTVMFAGTVTVDVGFTVII